MHTQHLKAFPVHLWLQPQETVREWGHVLGVYSGLHGLLSRRCPHHLIKLFVEHQSCQKWKFFIDLKVAKNGNYLPYDSSCQKWQKNDCTELPKMAIKGLICYSIEHFSHFFAISGNILLH